MEDWTDAIEDEYDEEKVYKAEYKFVQTLLFNYPNALVDQGDYF